MPRTLASTLVLASVLYIPNLVLRHAGTSRTQASTLVLAHVLISLSSTPCGHTGHERAHRARSCPVCPYLCIFGHLEHKRAHRCSLVSCVSLSLYIWTPRIRVSTSVLARVLYVTIPLPSMSRGRTEHEQAHQCLLVSCMSLPHSSRSHGRKEHERAPWCSIVSFVSVS